MDINEKILLEKFNLPDETRVHKMHELVYNYLKTFHDTDHMEEIKHMREDVEKAIKGFEDAYGKRYEEVNKLLFKFWKVSKMDEKGNLFLRLSKEKALGEEWEILDGGDSIHLKIKIAAYPAKKEVAIKKISEIFPDNIKND